MPALNIRFNQKTDSSASSDTIPIFDVNSACDRARRAARSFAAADVEQSWYCPPSLRAMGVSGNPWTNLIDRSIGQRIGTLLEIVSLTHPDTSTSSTQSMYQCSIQ
jgi:hypothetical protein